MGDLSAHFNKSEFACHHCGKLVVDQKLIDGLEQLRALAGRRVFINDGYRCPEHNRQVGGVSSSMHLAGLAADVQVDQLDMPGLYALVSKIPCFATGGIGAYSDEGFIHVDVRPHGPARWGRIGAKDAYTTIDAALEDFKKKHGTR